MESIHLTRLPDFTDSYHWDDSAYSSPSAYGVEVVAAANVGGSYEFDMFVVLRATEGRKNDAGELLFRKGQLFYATDSGCSCPIPFDGVEWTPVTKKEVRKAFGDWANDQSSDYEGNSHDGELAETALKLANI